jgi:lactoylglutathione lyase
VTTTPPSSPATGRPFRVLGVQQIAVGAADKSDLRALWVDLLGLAVAGSYRSERENVDEDILETGAGAATVEIDLMQPIDPAAKPKVHEPALNHLGLWIDDLAAAVAWLSERGVRFTPGGIRRGASGHEVCFIHPKGSADAPEGGRGVLIELVQAPRALVAAMAELAAPESV